MAVAAPDITTLKDRLKATWMAGDFGQVARHIEEAAEEFMGHRAITPGMRVLDVACGTGNLCFPAARKGAAVTGVDIATNLLEQAKARAVSEGLEVRFDEGDAEALPYENAAFDLVVSMYGAMFAPRPERTAAELLRVCRPGGEIAMANWTPRGFIGEMFRVTGRHVPPAAGMPSPMQWGDENVVRERFGAGVSGLKMTPLIARMAFPFSPAETVEFFRLYYGPTQRAFAAVPEEKRAALRADLEALWSEHNHATDGTTDVRAEYLEVSARRA